MTAHKKFAKAPFPYYGGKSRVAQLVWEAFGGQLDRYLEPFFGSGAVLLKAPTPAKSEVVCDMSPHLSNFWRAIQADPDAVARHADFPTDHMTLHARHGWLRKWGVEQHDRVWNDAEYYDSMAAGWWAWGCSIWIGSGFAETNHVPEKVPNVGPEAAMRGTQQDFDRKHAQRPYVCKHTDGGQGVSMQGRDAPDVPPLVRGHHPTVCQGVESDWTHDKRPRVFPHHAYGNVVAMQSKDVLDGMPIVNHQVGGHGCNLQRLQLDGEGPMPLDGTRLQPWLRWLHERLRRVIVLHRSWESGVTDVMTMKAAKGKAKVGIFLDPPYKTEHRSKALYGSDLKGQSDDIATAAYEWAVAKSIERPEIKIAYCCRHGDFPLPDEWTEDVRGFAGVNDAERRENHKDCIMFSPSCFDVGKVEQEQLF